MPAALSTSYCADCVSHSQATLGGNHFSFPFTYFTGDTGVTVPLVHLNNARFSASCSVSGSLVSYV